MQVLMRVDGDNIARSVSHPTGRFRMEDAK